MHKQRHQNLGNVYVPGLSPAWTPSASTLPWLVLGLLFLARASAAVGYQSSGSLLPLLIPAIGINYTEAGMLVGAFLLPGVFLSLPAGWLARRWGDERVLLLGLVVLIAGLFLLTRTNSLSAALLARAVSGAGAAAILVVASKVLSDWFSGAALVLPMMLLVNSWPLGIGVALQVQPAIGMKEGWQTAVAWSALPAALACLLAWALRNTLRGSSGSIQLDTASAERTGNNEAAYTAWRPQVFALTSAAYAIFGGLWAVVFSFSASYLNGDGMDVLDASHWTAVVSWCAVPVAPVAGWLAGRTAVVRWLGPVCFAISAVLLMSLPLWNAPQWALIVVGIVGCVPGGLLNAQAAQSLPTNKRAIGLGLFWSSYFAGIAIIPVIAGRAREVSGLGSAPLQTAGLLAAIAAVMHTLARHLECAKVRQ